MINLTETNNRITVTPIACPVFSPAIYAAGAKPLAQVRVAGLEKPKVYSVSINIYGLSKAGFFIERTPAFSGELICEKDSDTAYFDFTSVSLSVKKEFFANLKAPVAGKLCVEVTVDGTKYMGDAPVTLLPHGIFPSSASPVVFASILSPCHPEIKKIADIPECRSFSGLYDVLRRRRMVYSVRECDFVLHDVSYESMDTIFTKRSAMVTPLEMALIYCSCALRAGLRPALAVLKGKKAPHILCGVVKEAYAFSLPVCTSGEKLRSVIESGKASFFDVSCLFTGHSIELDDAERAAYEKTFDEELIYAVDICTAFSQGVKIACPDKMLEEETAAVVKSFLENTQTEKKDISSLAESLCDSEHSSLVDFVGCNKVSVSFSDLSKAEKAAFSKDRIIVCDARNATQSDFEAILASAKALLSDKKGELYLACGFLNSSKLSAPLALYPVDLICGDDLIYFEFLSPKPYLNRLVCEKLRSTATGKKFFAENGLPNRSVESILDCFKNFCAASGGEYALSQESALGRFECKDSLISFQMIDRYEKITSDPLSLAILSDEKKENEWLTDDCEVDFADTAFCAPDLFAENELAAASFANDRDLVVDGVDFAKQCRISTAVTCNCLRHGKRAVVVSENRDERRAVLREFKKLGLDNAVLILSSDTDIKASIREKLISLSQIPVPLNIEGDDGEISDLRNKFAKYYSAKNRRYSFAFTFNEAAKAYIRAGRGLSDEEKKICLEPETIFFPDLSRESAEAVFASPLALCRAASKLTPCDGFSKHPLFRARLTEEVPDQRTFLHLAEKCDKDLSDLSKGCENIARETGFELDALKNLPSVHAFLSLNVLISKEYDKNTTKELLCSDIYAVSKKIADLKGCSAKIAEIERELCEFDREIYTVCGSELFVEWTSHGEMSHSEITKKINSFRTVSVPSDLQKKTVPEVLQLLSEREKQADVIESSCDEMQTLFGEYWNGSVSDWNKISKLVDFVKMADVLLKKIYGTDSQARHDAAEKFPSAHTFCSDKLNVAAIIGTAGVFDRTFSDDGGFVSLSKMLGADLYNMNFDSGIFSDLGIEKMLSDWKSAADQISDVANYNKCAAECEKRGLSCFVKYLENSRYNENTQKIFNRSLLSLALKQISFNDRSFYLAGEYSEDAARYALLSKEKAVRNLNAQKLAYVENCVNHINSNAERSKAFGESIDDARFSAEELILRHSDTIKTLFPIIIAEPYYAGILSDFENMIVCSAHFVPTARVLPALNVARHKLIFTGERSAANDSFATDCINAGLPIYTLCREDVYDNCRFYGNKKIEFLRSPLTSFDKERHTNVLEAQTVGLEIMKELEKDSGLCIGVLTFSENQCHAITEVLSAVAEKSEAVANAMNSGMISVSYAGAKLKGTCDILYVSTVYGKDDISGGCITCGVIDDERRNCFGGFELSCAVLESGAERTVVVSSASCDKHPETAASRGAIDLFAFAGIACSGGKMIRGGKEDSYEVYDKYLLEFCRIMTENGFDVRTAEYGRRAIVTLDEKEYAVITENAAAGAAFERSKLKRAGYDTVFVDKTDIVMNPAKIVDTIKKLKEEKA